MKLVILELQKAIHFYDQKLQYKVLGVTFFSQLKLPNFRAAVLWMEVKSGLVFPCAS